MDGKRKVEGLLLQKRNYKVSVKKAAAQENVVSGHSNHW
jgi:hypothetical protein